VIASAFVRKQRLSLKILKWSMNLICLITTIKQDKKPLVASLIVVPLEMGIGEMHLVEQRSNCFLSPCWAIFNRR
jgi:hypothetical protein